MTANQGATLAEVLLTLCLLGIISTMGAAGHNELLSQQRASVASNLVLGAIRFARMAAIYYQNTVTLCPRSSGLACGRDWSKGVLAFLDIDGSGSRTAEEPALKLFPGLIGGGALRWRSFGNKPYLRFGADGMTHNQSGNFQYCPLDGNSRHSRQVILHASGRARSARDSDGDGVVENSRGKPLTCP